MKKRKTPDLEKYLEGKKRRFVKLHKEQRFTRCPTGLCQTGEKSRSQLSDSKDSHCGSEYSG